tara:strand:+ start:451 stop:561 length:111 start_codon:yes stop_codon:yes gene_type:complete
MGGKQKKQTILDSVAGGYLGKELKDAVVNTFSSIND